MSGAGLEAFLARVFVDPEARARFLADREGEARRAGLADEDRRTLAALDPDDLELAARSFAHKRGAQRPGARVGWWQALRRTCWGEAATPAPGSRRAGR